MRSVLAITLTALACGCASGPSKLPVVETVCLTINGLQEHEESLVRRKATEYLKSYDFQVVSQDCAATATYTRFGAFQAETVRMGVAPFTVSRSGYWSQEGTVAVVRAGKPELEDHQVNLRGYKTMQDLLNDLAWQMVRPITWLYQPGATPTK